jgi:hypothetical protein
MRTSRYVLLSLGMLIVRVVSVVVMNVRRSR